MCRWRISTPGDLIDREMKLIRAGKLLPLIGGSYFAPFVALIRTPVLQIAVIALCVYILYMSSTTLSLSDGLGAEFTMYRISLQADPSIAEPISVTSILITVDGCPIQHVLNLSSSYVACVEPTKVYGLAVNGIWNSNRVQCFLEGSNDHGITWYFAGSSDFRWTDNGIRIFECGS